MRRLIRVICLLTRVSYGSGLGIVIYYFWNKLKFCECSANKPFLVCFTRRLNRVICLLTRVSYLGIRARDSFYCYILLLEQVEVLRMLCE